MISYKKAFESGVVSLKNNLNGNLERIAFTTGVQVGIREIPADLQLLGGLSFSTTVLDLLPNETKKLEKNHTIFLIKSEATSGQFTLILPDSPRNGHRILIKDHLGIASSVSISVDPAPKQKIENSSSSYVINTAYGFVDLVWYETNWSVVSSPSKSIVMFGCSSTNVGASTDYLNPGGVGAASTTSQIYLPCPSTGTIRNLSIKQNTAGTTSAGTANLTYTVLVNGTATGISKDVDVTSTSVVTESDNRTKVVVGDEISIRVSIPANVNLGPANVVATMEIVS